VLNGLSGLAASVSALALGSGSSAAQPPALGHGVHALTVLARALRDPRLAPATPGPAGREDVSALLTSAAAEKRAVLLELSEQWCAACEITSDAVLEAKIEELVWLSAVVYAVGGCGVGPDGAFFADFFLCASHCDG
jgi:thiol:disulfide interchange protein